MAVSVPLTTVRNRNTFSVGLMIALGSWGLIFVTLIWGYVVYRLKLSSWLGSYISSSVMILAAVNTVLIVISSWSLSLAFKKEAIKSKIWAWSTFGLGLMFLVGQWYLWRMIMALGLHWQKSIAGSFFFLLTGFHFIHIVGALLAVMILCLRLDTMRSSPLGVGIKYFWDFLLVVWLVMYTLIFIIQ